jgi:hypothetical protein
MARRCSTVSTWRSTRGSGGDHRPQRFGKTTLLRSINLLEQPESGTIRVGDVTIDAGRSISQQKGPFAACASMWALCSRTLIFSPSYGAGKHY